MKFTSVLAASAMFVATATPAAALNIFDFDESSTYMVEITGTGTIDRISYGYDLYSAVEPPLPDLFEIGFFAPITSPTPVTFTISIGASPYGFGFEGRVFRLDQGADWLATFETYAEPIFDASEAVSDFVLSSYYYWGLSFGTRALGGSWSAVAVHEGFDDDYRKLFDQYAWVSGTWQPETAIVTPNNGTPIEYVWRNGQFTIPEPSTWAMLIVGFGLVGLAIRRERLAEA